MEVLLDLLDLLDLLEDLELLELALMETAFALIGLGEGELRLALGEPRGELLGVLDLLEDLAGLGAELTELEEAAAFFMEATAFMTTDFIAWTFMDFEIFEAEL